jgi:hypothetical protein
MRARAGTGASRFRSRFSPPSKAMLEGAFGAVDGGAQLAQVLEEELPARRVAAQAEMFARHVGQRFQFDVGPVIAPPRPTTISSLVMR